MERPSHHLGATEAPRYVEGRRNILIHRIPGAIVVQLREGHSPIEGVPPESVLTGRALAAFRREHTQGEPFPAFEVVRTTAWDPEGEREFDPRGRRGTMVLAGHDEVLAAVELLQSRFGPDLPVQDNLPDRYWERRERIEAHAINHHAAVHP